MLSDVLYATIQVHRSVVTMRSPSHAREGPIAASVTKVLVDRAPPREISTIIDEANKITILVPSSPTRVSYLHPTARSHIKMSGRDRGHGISKPATWSTAKKNKTLPLPADYASSSASAHLPAFTPPFSTPLVGSDSTPHTSGVLLGSGRNRLLTPRHAPSGVPLLASRSNSPYMVIH